MVHGVVGWPEGLKGEALEFLDLLRDETGHKPEPKSGVGRPSCCNVRRAACSQLATSLL